MKLTLPRNKVLCPYCFRQFHPSECTVVAEMDGTILVAPPKGAKKLYRTFVRERLGGDAALRLPRLQCPGCQRNWPKDIELAENHFVALVATRGAGKANYLAMVIDQLKNDVRVKQAIGVARIRTLGSQAEVSHRCFYESLVKDHRTLHKTTSMPPPLIGEPLIYRLELSQSAGERRPVYLYLYEIHGEDTLDGAHVVEYARFLSHASAIILLADPFAMPNMRKYILPSYHPSELPSTSPLEMLFHVVELYQRHLKRKFNLPLAITISKSDMLQFADPQRRSSLFATPPYANPSLASPLQLGEFEQVSNDVKRLLQVYGDTNLVTWAEQHERVGFFAVSSTGWPPDPQTGIYPDIQPLRVLDPLLWVLHQLGVIHAE